jgi:hypothetical protein
MTIDQVIAAQEANEAAVMNGRITISDFNDVAAKLGSARSAAMAAINARIAARYAPT